jgi:TPR repeat protein
MAKYPLIPMLSILLTGILAVAEPALAARFEDGVAAYQRNDFAAALKFWQPLADAGNAEAQDRIGLLYANGQGVTKDEAKAVEWYRKAADQGNADAELNISAYYLRGYGPLPRNVQIALVWLQKSAAQNSADAEFKLGFLYLSPPYEISRDPEKAAAWFRKAADQGYQVAEMELGQLYAQGFGVKQDKEQALFWLRKASDQGGLLGPMAKQLTSILQNNPAAMPPVVPSARLSPTILSAMANIRRDAERGDATSQRALGDFYAIRGFAGSTDDAQQAMAWWRKAADQGNTQAMNKLGVAYLLGKFVPRDAEQSASWVRRAAETDDPIGELQLGMDYAIGNGVPHDRDQAVFWLRKAEAHGGLVHQQAESAIANLN